jgi:hypothetical protein
MIYYTSNKNIMHAQSDDADPTRREDIYSIEGIYYLTKPTTPDVGTVNQQPLNI